MEKLTHILWAICMVAGTSAVLSIAIFVICAIIAECVKIFL